MNIEKTIEYFASLVDKRFEVHGHNLPSEDNIRYDFFYALTHKNDIKPWEVILEAPYPLEILNLDSNSCEIDLIVKPTQTIPNGLICEFKYDRKSNSTMNKTNRYGKLVNDLLRLCLLKENSPHYHSIFIYVTDIEMMKYKNGFFYSQVANTDFELTNEFISSLQASAKVQVNPIFLNPFVAKTLKATCKLIFRKALDNSHGIFAWTVSSSQQAITKSEAGVKLLE